MMPSCSRAMRTRRAISTSIRQDVDLSSAFVILRWPRGRPGIPPTLTITERDQRLDFVPIVPQQRLSRLWNAEQGRKIICQWTSDSQG
jgi:hypothetical protein